MQIHIIDSFDALSKYESKYREFLNHFEGVSAQFYSFEYIQVSYQYFEKLGASLFFILCFDDDELIALFPFQRTILGPRGAIKIIKFWGDVNSEIRNQYCNLFILNNHEQVIEDVTTRLNTDLINQWDKIEFSEIELDNTICTFIKHFHKKYFVLRSKSYIFQHNLPHTLKNNNKLVDKSLRKLNREVSNFEVIIDTEITDDVYQQLADTHTEHQVSMINRGISRRVIFENSNEFDYFKSLLLLWRKQGWLRCYRLVGNGMTLAYNIIRISKDEATATILAFRSDSRKYQPTRVLYQAAYNDLFEDNSFSKLDFGWGMTPPKEEYSNYSQNVYNIGIISHKLRSRIVLKSYRLFMNSLPTVLAPRNNS